MKSASPSASGGARAGESPQLRHNVIRPGQIVCLNTDTVCPNSDKVFNDSDIQISFAFSFAFNEAPTFFACFSWRVICFGGLYPPRVSTGVADSMTQNDHNENSFAWAFGGDVVRVMPGGMPPPTPPLLVTSPPFFVFFKKRFLANERDNIFGKGVKNDKKPHKTLTNKWRAQGQSYQVAFWVFCVLRSAFCVLQKYWFCRTQDAEHPIPGLSIVFCTFVLRSGTSKMSCQGTECGLESFRDCRQCSLFLSRHRGSRTTMSVVIIGVLGRYPPRIMRTHRQRNIIIQRVVVD